MYGSGVASLVRSHYGWIVATRPGQEVVPGRGSRRWQSRREDILRLTEELRYVPLHSRRRCTGFKEVGQEEIDALTDVLHRKKIFRFLLSDQDSYSSRLEDAYRRFTGKKHALAVTGGTTSLITALVGLGVGTGDEVIVPGYTYIASAAAVLSVGAIPVIAEVDDTLTLDPVDMERKVTRLTKAVMPVHMRGLPAQMDEIIAIARKHDLKVVEDVAQANGGTYQGRALGSIGHAGCFSFQHFKVITSGEGGMVVTDDEEVFARAAFKHDSAMQFWKPGWTVRPFAGENARMCELRAAVGLVQYGRMQAILGQTRRIKRRIVQGIMGLPGISLQRVSDPAGDCGITVMIYLPTRDEAKRFSEALRWEGIPNGTIYNQGVPDRHIYTHWDYVLNKWSSDPTGYPWSPQYYKGDVEYSPDMCPVTLGLLGRAVSIGISQRHTDADADDIVRGIEKVALAYYR